MPLIKVLQESVSLHLETETNLVQGNLKRMFLSMINENRFGFRFFLNQGLVAGILAPFFLEFYPKTITCPTLCLADKVSR